MVTVNTDGGGDYLSLAAAIAGEQSTTGDLIIECAGVLADAVSSVSGMAFSTLVIEGDGSAAGRYTGNEDFSTGHYRIEHSGSGACLTIIQSNVTVRGIQCLKTGTAAVALWCQTSDNVSLDGIRVDQQTRHQGVNTAAGTGFSMTNCIVKAPANGDIGFRGLITHEADTTLMANNVFKGASGNNTEAALRVYGTITQLSNNTFIGNKAGVDIVIVTGSITNESNNATDQGSLPNAPTNAILSITTPADYMSATDHRPKLGGKLFRAGSRANIPRPDDITGSPWEWPNVSPFSEFVADTVVTVNTDNVGPPDYSSLSAAIAGESATAGGLHIKCSGVQADPNSAYFTGMAATGILAESDPDHVAGLYKGTDNYSTSHYRLELTGTPEPLRVQQLNVALKGLQACKVTGSNANECLVSFTTASSENLYLDSLRIKQETASQGIRTQNDITISCIQNCIIDGTGIGTSGIEHNGFIEHLDNNVIANWATRGVGTFTAGRPIINTFNNQFHNNNNDAQDFGVTPTNVGNNATDKNADVWGDTGTIKLIVAGTDFVSVTDFRSVDQGKLDEDGDSSQLPLTDIIGVPFVNANVSPFNEIFTSGPAPSGGYSYGYMVG